MSDKKAHKPTIFFIPHVRDIVDQKESDYITVDEEEREKRCNAYPRLVAVLQAYNSLIPTKGVADLLKELGEKPR